MGPGKWVAVHTWFLFVGFLGVNALKKLQIQVADWLKAYLNYQQKMKLKTKRISKYVSYQFLKSTLSIIPKKYFIVLFVYKGPHGLFKECQVAA